MWAEAQVTYQQADSITVCRLLAKANTKTSSLWFARQFLGVPYVAHTLEVNDQEQLVVNTRQLDCTTLVETVTALTLCARQGKRSWNDYLQILQMLRYRQGKLDGYPSRLHYFSDWIRDKQAMKIVRDHASEWGVDPAKIGVQGNSAGGHLIARLATEFEDEVQRPAFQILFYGALTMINEPRGTIAGKVTEKTPQAFILCSQDDMISVYHSLDYMTALKEHNVPSTLHVYASGGHGWGFKDSFTYKEQWTSELAAWLKEINK